MLELVDLAFEVVEVLLDGLLIAARGGLGRGRGGVLVGAGARAAIAHGAAATKRRGEGEQGRQRSHGEVFGDGAWSGRSGAAGAGGSPAAGVRTSRRRACSATVSGEVPARRSTRAARS